MKKFILILNIFIFFIIFIVFVSVAGNKDTKKAPNNEALYVLNVSTFGSKYPYVIDNLILRCESASNNDKDLALWLEDIDGNKYGLNGTAKTKFLNDKSYKGYSELILKDNMNDIYSEAEAENICLRTGV